MQLLTNQAPAVLGGWCLLGIISASMSTGSGAVLAMGTVIAHNVARHLDRWFPNFVTSDNLLQAARFSTIPFTLASTLIAGYYRSSSSTGGTGYLLTVAFDIVLASVVVPLFGCFYTAYPSPRAALLAILGGVATRIILEFSLPKDGFFLMPYDDPAFLDYGPAASTLYPAFIDVDRALVWNPSTEPCNQKQFGDYSGVDSLAALLVCFIVFVSIQFVEFRIDRPLFKFGGMEGYVKDTSEHPLKHDLSGSGKSEVANTTKHSESYLGETQSRPELAEDDDDMGNEEEFTEITT
jgi:Na+/proline symporter